MQQQDVILPREGADSATTNGIHPLRPRLRPVAAPTIAAVNQLACGLRWPIDWDGRTWHVRLAPPATLAADHTLLLSLHWKNVAGYLALSPHAAETLLAPRCGSVLWGDLAEDLALALLQDAADRLTGQQDHPRRASVLLRGWARQEEAAAMPFAIEVQLAPDAAEAPLSCYFLTDLRGLRQCARLCRRPPQTGWRHDWEWLPFPVTLELGWVDLPLSQLGLIEPQDILLPDGWWRHTTRNAVCLRISPRLGIAAQVVEGAVLQTTSKVITMEQEPFPHAGDATPHPTPEPAELADLPLRITFDLGERTLTLQELSHIVPGHIFDLGLQPAQAVNLRINGVRVGEGELVEIDGRIGVAVTRLTPLRT